MTPDPRDTLRVALAPRCVAVIGASDNANKIGGRPIAYLKRFGFKGAVYPINPSRDTLQGLHAYPGLDALPEVPDMVVIAVPGELAVQAVDQCAAAGVRVAVVMASGFGETPDPVARAIGGLLDEVTALRARVADLEVRAASANGAPDRPDGDEMRDAAGRTPAGHC